MEDKKEQKKKNRTISGLKKLGMAALTIAGVVVKVVSDSKNKQQ